MVTYSSNFEEDKICSNKVVFVINHINFAVLVSSRAVRISSRAVRISSRAVRISSRALCISSRGVRVFPALSLRRVRPSHGTFFLWFSN